eukprot:g5328.t1
MRLVLQDWGMFLLRHELRSLLLVLLPLLEKALYLVTLVYPFASIVIMLLGVTGEVRRMGTFEGCILLTKWWVTVFVMICDTVISVGFLYLFIAPFRKLPLRSESHRVAIRNLKTSVIVLVSTFIAMLLMTISNNPTDEITSSWSCHLDVIVNNVTVFWGTIWAWRRRDRGNKHKETRRRVHPQPQQRCQQSSQDTAAKLDRGSPLSSVPVPEMDEPYEEGTMSQSFYDNPTTYLQMNFIMEEKPTSSMMSSLPSRPSSDNISSSSEGAAAQGTPKGLTPHNYFNREKEEGEESCTE